MIFQEDNNQRVSGRMNENGNREIMLNINHFRENSAYGNVYMGNSNGDKFRLILEKNVRHGTGFVDFKKIKGVPGYFVANLYDKTAVMNYDSNVIDR